MVTSVKGITDTERLAAEIRAEMGRQRKRVREFAQVIGRTEPTARNRLSGRFPFTVDELAATARWLGKSLTDLATAAGLDEGEAA